MTWTVTERGFDTGQQQSSLTSNTYQPAANSLLVCAICDTGDGGTISSFSGHGTWTKITEGVGPGSGPPVYQIWALNAGASPSSTLDTLTFSGPGTPFHSSALFLEISETSGLLDTTTVTNNFGAIDSREGYSFDSAYGGGTATAIPPSFAQSDNLALGIAASRDGTVGSLFDWEGTFTKLTENSGSRHHMCAAYKGSEDTSISCVIDDFVHMTVFGVEVKHAVVGLAGILLEETPGTNPDSKIYMLYEAE